MDQLNDLIKNYKNSVTASSFMDSINIRKSAVSFMIIAIEKNNLDKDDVVKALNDAGILEEVRAFIKSHRYVMPAQLLGGNRHTKRTKRTTHRKMRKSLIRRRR